MVNKIDKRVSIVIVSIFVILSLQYFLLVFFNVMGSERANIIQILSQIIVGISFLSVFPLLFKLNFSKILTIYCIFGLVFFLNYLIYPNNRSVLIDNSFQLFFISAPILIYTLCLNDLSVFRKIFRQGSHIIFILSLLTTIFVVYGKRFIGVYSMTLSYYTLIPALFYLDDFLSRFHFRSLFLFLISVFIIVAVGARGPLIPIVLYGFVKLFTSKSKGNKNTIILKLTFAFISILLILFFRDIILFLLTILDKIGWQSRTLNLFLTEEISLSGRDDIYNIAWNLISDKPLFGYGLLSDRLYFGSYAHNLFLELFMHFGILLGIVFSFLIFLLGILSYFKDKNNIILLLFNLSIIPLMVSSSYLIQMTFWIFLGICINIVHSNKKVIKIN